MRLETPRSFPDIILLGWNAISERVRARPRRAIGPAAPPRARPEVALHLVVVLSVSLTLIHVSPAAAHNAVRQPDLGTLVLKEQIVVRGTIRRETRSESGLRIAVLGVEKVLKGAVEEQEIRFASDPDHGVRYASGERVLVFLSRTGASAAQRRATPYVSPQVFSMKYPITSFDPTGYDRLVTGLVEAEKMNDRAARLGRLKELLVAQLGSHERKVRLYAADTLRVVAAGGRSWNDADRKQLLAYTSDAKSDPEVREALRGLTAP